MLKRKKVCIEYNLCSFHWQLEHVQVEKTTSIQTAVIPESNIV